MIWFERPAPSGWIWGWARKRDGDGAINVGHEYYQDAGIRQTEGSVEASFPVGDLEDGWVGTAFGGSKGQAASGGGKPQMKGSRFSARLSTRGAMTPRSSAWV